MDDVWKDLSLSFLNHHSTATVSTAQPPISKLDFQDLLSCPLNKFHRSKSDEQKSSSSTVSKPQIKVLEMLLVCDHENAAHHVFDHLPHLKNSSV